MLYPTDSRTATDYSLPTPHRLSVELYVAGSNDQSLVTAAASSAARGPEVLRSIFSQKRMTATKPIVSGSSSATCPVQLLAISLIMSDESVLPAYQVPPNHLRISSLDSDLVWDPAVPMQQLLNEAKRAPESTTTTTTTTSVYVRVNSLIAWDHSYNPTQPGSNPYHSVPLCAMDDVVIVAQSGRTIPDPGPPQDPSRWFSQAHETPIDRREAVPTSNTVDGATGRYSIWSSPVGQSDYRTMFVSGHNANKRTSVYDQINGQENRPTNFITHILIWVGVIAVLLFAVNCTVLLALKKRRQTRASRDTQPAGNQRHYSKANKTSVGHIDLYNVEGNECTVKTNGSGEVGNLTAGSPLIPCSQFGYLPSYSDVHSGHLMMGSSSPQQVETMTAGLSCSSMGSTHSGPVGSLKQSMVMDSAVNPYLMLSEGSSIGGAGHSSKNSHPANIPQFSVSYAPIGYRAGAISSSPPSWNSPASMTPAVYPKPLPNMTVMQSANANSQSPVHMWPASLSPTNSGPCNPGYTSGLGSVGTCEGYSDEGVASGFEMISLSQEVVNITGNNGLPQLHRTTTGPMGRMATGGTSSTTSGGSANGVRAGPTHRAQMSTFKPSPTSGLGAGSLSGGSSSADASEFRAHRTPESGGLNEIEMDTQLPSRGPSSADNMYVPQLSTSQFRASPKVPPPPLRPSLMTESFSGAKSAGFGMSANYAEKNSSDSPNTALRESGLRHHSSLRNDHSVMIREGLGSHDAHALSALPPDPELLRDSSLLDELEEAPVPMPPALLLNNHGCFEALSESNRTGVSNNLPNPNALKLSSTPETGLNFGSYKRSDSFGMATKAHATGSCRPSAGFGTHGEMVGDTLDTSDEVSSGSKSSSAVQGETKFAKLSEHSRTTTSRDSGELTYLHSIPPPEL
ncbi:unnamed protein product [Echinostoma caproni]|uniref:Fibronectin type-III domain-containing protein n=1 Tax=Echinostoma caproni TaxID=27848 RepID=A0A183AFY8_9TREM|nr:unnamed protein product [Echinostoma caproni]